jgi:hypothetical protein
MKNISTMTLKEFYDYLDTLYPTMPTGYLVTLRKLKNALESWVKEDRVFGKHTIQHIEKEHPHFLLNVSHPSIPVYLLYKELVTPKKKS